MKDICIVLISLLVIGSGSLSFSGDLIPPAGPSPSMKTLDEVEARIPIHGIPFTISEPGSYYLVHDLGPAPSDTDGITIELDNVTLDLNGYALVGAGKAAGTTGDGVKINSIHRNISISNGTIRDWRMNGIDGATALNSRYFELRIYNNGGHGMHAGDSSSINNCVSYMNGSHGINALTGCIISSCISNTNSGLGIGGYTACTISNNTTNGNNLTGISSYQDCLVSNNTCTLNNGGGIEVYSGCKVINNVCNKNEYGAGILVKEAGNMIKENHCTANEWGIKIEETDNIIEDNIAKGNTTPINSPANNQLNILISELPYNITLPGCYKVTGRLILETTGSHGITIASDNVTLDLGGHVLVGPGKDNPPLESGIYVESVSADRHNITITNGTLRDWSNFGIEASCFNSHFEDLKCYLNGESGIYAGTGCLVKNCNSAYNDGYGIWTREGCMVVNNTSCFNKASGIIVYDGCTVTENSSYGNEWIGISTDSGCTIQNNSCCSNHGYGIYTNDDCSVIGNTCSENELDGISLSTNCLVRNNVCCDNGADPGDGAGIYMDSWHNCVEQNLVVDNDYGIKTNTSGNYIAGNRASGNGDNYGGIYIGNTLGTGDLANVTF